MADKTAFDVLNALTEKGHLFEPAAEKLRLVLNEIIDEQQLDHATVLATLARLSAAYVHQLQRGVTLPDYKELMENTFYELFQAFLAYSEEYEKHLEKEKEEDLEKN